MQTNRVAVEDRVQRPPGHFHGDLAGGEDGGQVVCPRSHLLAESQRKSGGRTRLVDLICHVTFKLAAELFRAENLSRLEMEM